MSTAARHIPATFAGFVDDAAIFPPGNAPLSEAVAAHLRHRQAWYADLLGGFVVDDARLPDLPADLPSEAGAELAVHLVVTGGAGALPPAVTWARRTPGVSLRAVEIRLRDEESLAHNSRRVLAAVEEAEVDEETVVYVEPPRFYSAGPPATWLAALDELAAADVRLKFRTGGETPDAFPSADELAACIDAALDRELAFKCTAGLHFAAPYDDEAGPHLGFLGVLNATRASLDGDDVAEALRDPDPATRTRGYDEAALASARRWFVGIGSCSVEEPLTDLIDLGFVTPPKEKA